MENQVELAVEPGIETSLESALKHPYESSTFERLVSSLQGMGTIGPLFATFDVRYHPWPRVTQSFSCRSLQWFLSFSCVENKKYNSYSTATRSSEPSVVWEMEDKDRTLITDITMRVKVPPSLPPSLPVVELATPQSGQGTVPVLFL